MIMKNFFFTLPEELIVEILLRLPVKSLLCFKRVCKLWFSLISDPQFAKSHFDLAHTPVHRLVMMSRDGSQIKSLDFESSLTDTDTIRFKFPPTPLSLYIVDCCRGIMLLATRNHDVVVWNPSTGTYRQLPVSYNELLIAHNEELHTLRGFGYDKSRDDYLLVLIRYTYDPHIPKVVKNSYSQIQVFSLKTSASSFIYGVDFDYTVGCTTGLFFNQSLHWLAKSKATQLSLILAFDLINGSLSEIHLSQACEHGGFSHLKVQGECLSLHHETEDNGAYEIWIMKEYKVKSSWVRSFVLRPNRVRGVPIWFTKDGALLASSSDDENIMTFYENGEVLYNHDFTIYSYPPHVYRESLLPLP